jgi:hypothetical protein
VGLSRAQLASDHPHSKFKDEGYDMITPDGSAATETELLALTGVSLRTLRADQSRELAAAVALVLQQVSRPRANLGGSGPPGRAD